MKISLFTLSLHLFFWIAFYLVPFVDPKGVQPIPNEGVQFLDEHLLVNHLYFIFVFYFNSAFLIPRILKKSKLIYITSLVLLVILVLWLSYLIFPLLPTYIPPPNLGRGIPSPDSIRGNQLIALSLPLLFILFVSISYRLLADRFRDEKLRKEKETENLKTELSFLRSQISPHFIFNALNSSIILVRKQSDKAEDSLLKLASIIRYMLYESDEDKVSIQDELEYISDYIDLQTIRFGDAVKIIQRVDIPNELELNIEPMLLIPYIENAFKHGTSVIDSPEIEIHIYIKNNKFQLDVSNKFKETNSKLDSKNQGIGLVNVKRRLDLLYPSKYELTVRKESNWYSVSLSLAIL
jgi:two-component system, LytTR family, sensor kinase